ncbi:MAG: hypothetical protein WAO00_12720 [Chthoniobacterales bacterium]
MKPIFLSLLFCAFAAGIQADDLKTVEAFRDAAAKANSILTLPEWEQTP